MKAFRRNKVAKEDSSLRGESLKLRKTLRGESLKEDL
jgi:hypothetical protein